MGATVAVLPATFRLHFSGNRLRERRRSSEQARLANAEGEMLRLRLSASAGKAHLSTRQPPSCMHSQSGDPTAAPYSHLHTLLQSSPQTDTLAWGSCWLSLPPATGRGRHCSRLHERPRLHLGPAAARSAGGAAPSALLHSCLLPLPLPLLLPHLLPPHLWPPHLWLPHRCRWLLPRRCRQYPPLRQRERP